LIFGCNKYIITQFLTNGENMKLQIAFLFSIILLITGCSISNEKVNTPILNSQSQSQQQTNIKSKIIDDTPNWILNPDKQNYICATGSSKVLNDKKTMKKIAFMRAKANISIQIKIYINTQSKLIQNSNGKSKFTISSTHQSTNMLKNIKIMNTYIDEKNQIYYIRVCSKKH
jgi:hypothetical protein